MAKLNLDEDKLMKRGGQSKKVIFLAIEVWVDVLGFVRRIQLASVCLANWKIYEICWPRLHGDKVMAHPVRNIVIGYCYESGYPKALFLKDKKKVPFPECPPPAYITGFERIEIKYLDHQVLAFFSLISTRITTKQIRIEFTKKMTDLDENQIASLNRLLQIFREKITTLHSIHLHRCLSNIQFMPYVDNEMEILDCWGVEESDIPIFMEFLASPRPDGQQQVMKMRMQFWELSVEQKLLDAIKKRFRTSTQPVPQPFFLQLRTDLNIPSEDENPHTDETLTIALNPRDGCLEICRHPRDQHEKWAEDARKRLLASPIDNSITRIIVDISDPGPAWTMGLGCKKQAYLIANR